MDYSIFVIDWRPGSEVPVDSVTTLFDGWGRRTRIEDIPFLPREKIRLIDGT